MYTYSAFCRRELMVCGSVFEMLMTLVCFGGLDGGGSGLRPRRGPKGRERAETGFGGLSILFITMQVA